MVDGSKTADTGQLELRGPFGCLIDAHRLVGTQNTNRYEPTVNGPLLFD